MENLTGRLTADAEVREVSERTKVVGFTIAVNHSYMSGEQRREIARFFECSYWRNAGIAEFLKKGDVLQVFGHVGCRAYVTRDAEAEAALTFRVAEIKLFSGSGKAAVTSVLADEVNVQGSNGGDLPF